jgi:succinoglycan biosynthesis transport protein ExoP
MSYARPAPAVSQGFDAGRLIGALRRRWTLILLTALIGAATGYEIQELRTPLYTAGVTILIDPKRPDVYGADAHFANAMADTTKIGSIVPLISSTLLLKRVVQSEKLANNPYFGGPQSSLIDKGISLLPFLKPEPEITTPEMRETRAVYRLRRSVYAERMNMTYILNIKVSADTPVVAQRLASAVANAYLDDQRSNQQQATTNDGGWLARQVDDLRAELTHSEETVENIRQKYGLTTTGHQTEAISHTQHIADLNTQLSRADGEVTIWRAKAAQADSIRRNRGSLEGIPEVVASEQIGKFHLGLSDLDRKIADLTARYTASYPDLIQAKRDRQTLMQQIDAEASRIVESFHNKLEAAVTQRDNLRIMLAASIATNNVAEYDATNAKGRIALREAQRVVDVNRALYEAQLARLSRVKEQQTRGDVEARIISPAELPTSSTALLKSIFTMVGLFGGLLTGSGVSVIGMFREAKLVDIDWIESELSISCLGMLPLLKRSQLVRAGRCTVTEYLRIKPLSQFAECVRLLRTTLRFASTVPPRIIQVTSAVPGEGKSTIAVALAISSAQAGIRTVLVDLDVRNPSVSKIFNINAADGAADSTQMVSITGSALVPYEKLPLTIVGAGTDPRLRPDMVDTQFLKRLIQELANHCDLVVLDSPPVLAVADAIVISNVADVTLLVVQAETTPKNIVRQAVKMLRANRSPLAGFIINKFKRVGTSEYSAGSYGSYYVAVDVDISTGPGSTKAGPRLRGHS